jgi:hypothetical protein
MCEPIRISNLVSIPITFLFSGRGDDEGREVRGGDDVEPEGRRVQSDDGQHEHERPVLQKPRYLHLIHSAAKTRQVKTELLIYELV